MFQGDAKFILIEQITKKYNTKEELRLILKKRGSFWILNLRTLSRWFKSRTLQYITNFFTVVNCSKFGISTYVIGNWRL